MRTDSFKTLKDLSTELGKKSTIVEYGSSHSGLQLAEELQRTGRNGIDIVQIETDREKFEKAHNKSKAFERLRVYNYVPTDLKDVDLLFTEKSKPDRKDIDEIRKIVNTERPLLILPKARPAFPSEMEKLKYEFIKGGDSEVWLPREKKEGEYTAESASIVLLVIAIITIGVFLAIFIYMLAREKRSNLKNISS